mmetsp:Transcript_15630/g.28238  ORF Transcript_15630/g.28238 Transcript_15630/m.28238 type:complete len:276 (+) Transcript_15630:117-944(+)
MLHPFVHSHLVQGNIKFINLILILHPITNETILSIISTHIRLHAAPLVTRGCERGCGGCGGSLIGILHVVVLDVGEYGHTFVTTTIVDTSSTGFRHVTSIPLLTRLQPPPLFGWNVESHRNGNRFTMIVIHMVGFDCVSFRIEGRRRAEGLQVARDGMAIAIVNGVGAHGRYGSTAALARSIHVDGRDDSDSAVPAVGCSTPAGNPAVGSGSTSGGRLANAGGSPTAFLDGGVIEPRHAHRGRGLLLGRDGLNHRLRLLEVKSTGSHDGTIVLVE